MIDDILEATGIMSAVSKREGVYVPKILIIKDGKRSITAIMKTGANFLGYKKKDAALLHAQHDINTYGSEAIADGYNVQYH